METPEGNNQERDKTKDRAGAQNADRHEKIKPADDGFKTGRKTHGLTWESPMDEQAFDGGSLSRNPADEEAD